MSAPTLEAARKGTRHTQANLGGGRIKEKDRDIALRNAKKQIAQAKAKYAMLDDKDRELMGSLDDGDGLYEMAVYYANGNIRIKANSVHWTRAAASFSTNPSQNVRYFYAMAYRGVEHPDFAPESRNGYVVGQSPAEDAYLKMLNDPYIVEIIIAFIADEPFADDEGKRRYELMTQQSIEKLQAKEAGYEKIKRNREKAVKQRDIEFGEKTTKLTGRENFMDYIYDEQLSYRNYLIGLLKKIDELRSGLDRFRKEDRKALSDLTRKKVAISDELEKVRRLENLNRSNPDAIGRQIQLFDRPDLYDKMPFLKEHTMMWESQSNSMFDLAQYLIPHIRDMWSEEMTPSEVDTFNREGMGGDTITVDGDGYFYDDGVINFYIKGVPERLVDATTKYIVALLRHKGVKTEPPKKEESGMFKSEVVRVPVVASEELNETEEMDDRPLVEKFLDFVTDFLNLQSPVGITLTRQRDGLETTAAYDMANKNVLVYIGGRAIVDVLRSIAHELVHHYQNERGSLHGIESEGEDGSPMENEANAKAGEMIRIFGKQNPEIYH